MAQEIPVFLHAGAHRTGTSSFQNMLGLNQQRLLGHGYGVAFPGRDGQVGGKLRLKLPNRRDSSGDLARFVPGARRQLRRLSEGLQGIVLSEENVPGRMFHFFYGEFYPAAFARMQVLKQSLPGPLQHLIYVVRPYGDIYVSSYRKRAEDNLVDDFNDLRPNMMAMETGWVELIQMFQTLMKPRKITVIDYAARGRSTELLGRLLGGAIGGLEEPAQKLNQSATDAGLRALQQVYRAGGKLDRIAWQAIIQEHSDKKDSDGFATFSPAEGRVLAQKYLEDLDRISNLAGVNFIR